MGTERSRSRPRVLIVDDQKETCILLQAHLEGSVGSYPGTWLIGVEFGPKARGREAPAAGAQIEIENHGNER